MTVNTIKEKLENMVARASSIDGIILFVGVIALVVGILVDVFILRLLCLLAVMASAILVFLSLRGKGKEIHHGFHGLNSLTHSQFGSGIMKKLVFDDFQSQSGGSFMVEEVLEEAESPAAEISEPPEPMLASDDSTEYSAPGILTVRPEVKPIIKEFQVSDFFDVDSNIFKGDSEPRTEFDFLLNKVLLTIKEVLFAHSVAFFWANREKQQMVMEARVTDSPNFISSRRFPIGHDLVSKVAESGTPELITEVNPVSEQELFQYYESVEGVKSFAGVPVYFSAVPNEHTIGLPVAVIAVDSKTEDTFGRETLALLGQFTKLVSALIKSYTEKYDLLLDSELLRSLRRLQERIRDDASLQTIAQALSEETSKLINWDFLSIVLYDEKKHAWVAKKVTNRGRESYIIPEQGIDFPDSIVGQTIRSNSPTLVDDLESHLPPRYYSGEQLTMKGSFVSIPISSFNKCYGALNVESCSKHNFNKQNVEVLSRLAEQTASALEILYAGDIIREYVIIDDLTGVYSRKFFTQKIGDELHRADDTGTELTMLFITADKSNEISERFGQEGFERVMVTLSKVIRASVRPYDLVGRFDMNRFGVLLVNAPANDAYLWAEKIRKNVASHTMSLDGKSFSITISIGLCGALDGMKREEILANTTTVLNRASEAGGNAVRVF